MKRIRIAFLFLAIIFCAGCTSSQPSIADVSAIEPTATDTSTAGQTTQAAVEEEDEDGWGVDRYRPIYYNLNIFYTELVGSEAYRDWELSRTTEEYNNECIAISFIKHFGIPKEDFSLANEKTRERHRKDGYNPEDNAIYELYPVDLIYTFDNEKINEFFLWENSIYADQVSEN